MEKDASQDIEIAILREQMLDFKETKKLNSQEHKEILNAISSIKDTCITKNSFEKKTDAIIEAYTNLDQQHNKNIKEMMKEMEDLKYKQQSDAGKLVLIIGAISIVATVFLTKLSAWIWDLLTSKNGG